MKDFFKNFFYNEEQVLDLICASYFAYLCRMFCSLVQYVKYFIVVYVLCVFSVVTMFCAALLARSL